MNLTKKERRELARENKRLERKKKEKTAKFTKFIIKIVVIGLLAFGIYKFWVWVSTPTPAPETGGVISQPNITELDQIAGNPEGLLTLVEYSDFQCPACKSYSSIVKQLVIEHGQQMRFIYKHFPLISIHKNAFDAARAAEAAGRQGKFWEMHDLLFERQNDWSNEQNPKDKFIAYANELGIGEDVFKQDYESDEIESRVRTQIAEGNSLGVNSTPSFYLNDAKVTNPAGYEQFKSLIEQNIKTPESL